jgi:2-dehydro-3-deoxyphosphogluconate aldolase / (4S)-4-hydroxy-2-oxoglutarate aldolase
VSDAIDPIRQRIEELRLIPVIESPDPARAVPLADALAEGGLPCAEITFRTDGAELALRTIIEHHPEVMAGAGTIRTTDQVDAALDAGAAFLVSPGFNATVLRYAHQRDALMLPGVTTATELEMALAEGVSLVKFFPAEPAGGVRYLKALAAPYPDVRFVPTGGITDANLADYLAIPQVAAIGASWLAPRALIEAADFDGITKRVRAAVAMVMAAR